MPTFEKQALQKPGFFKRLLGIPEKDNAFREINNLFADKAVRDITAPEIQAILTRYKIEDPDPQAFEVILRPLLSNYLLDATIDEEEQADLDHLQNILPIGARQLDETRAQVARKLYREAYENAMNDDKINAAEEENLTELAQQLGLSDEVKYEIEVKASKAKVEGRLKSILEDGMYSPEEEKELTDLAKNINAKVNYDQGMQQKLKAYRRYWQLRVGPLPTIPSPYNLYKKETAHAHVTATWHEWKTTTRRYNYGGPTARIRLAKGFYWSAGSVGVQRQREDVLREIDQGELLLTNKRLLFVGQRNTKQIRLNRILDFEIFKNGLSLQKDAGKHPFLEIQGNWRELPVMLERLMEEA
jgi:uncharacterized protein YxjI